jgi:hypothetical protein
MSSAERDLRLHLMMTSSHGEEYEVIGRRFGLDPSHPAVEAHARALAEIEEKQSEIDRLAIELDEASHDPLTGFWLKGPGFSKVGDLISVVENNRAGLGDGDGPNAILGIGLDVEGLHYTNNWYGQKSGDIRLVQASRELRGVAEILQETVRTGARRHAQEQPSDEPDRRGGSADRRHGDFSNADVLIRTGGDELMAALPVSLTSKEMEEAVARAVLGRIADRKNQNMPDLRILRRVGFYQPGQTAEDFYHFVEPKAHFSRRRKLARPIAKVARLGFGQYRPPINVSDEL